MKSGLKLSVALCAAIAAGCATAPENKKPLDHQALLKPFGVVENSHCQAMMSEGNVRNILPDDPDAAEILVKLFRMYVQKTFTFLFDAKEMSVSNEAVDEELAALKNELGDNLLKFGLLGKLAVGNWSADAYMEEGEKCVVAIREDITGS